MIDRLIRRLRHVPGVLEAEEIAAPEAIITPPRRFRRGEDIIRQFSQPRESTLMLQGLSGRRVVLEDGAEQLTALHLPGDFVDLHAFILPRLDHSIAALTDCVVVSAPHGLLRTLTDRYPNLTRALWFLTAVDGAVHRQWLTMVGRRDAGQRLAHLLCELWLRFDDVELAEGRSLDLALRQSDLANILCLSTAHMNRTRQDFRARGLIAWRRGGLDLLDWPALVDAGMFEPTYLQLGEGRGSTPRT